MPEMKKCRVPAGALHFIFGTKRNELDVEILYIESIVLDEFAARFDAVPH
jgi:hypothetical protein